MGQLGSVSSPAFAGWQWVGSSGEAFAGLYTVPAGPDIIISEVHAYFNTYQGNGAVGYLVIWDGNDANANVALYTSPGFIINNGTLNAGGQQWWSKTGVNLQLAGGSKIWIGGLSSQGIVWSTYDTSPHTYDRAMTLPITGGTTWFNSGRNDTGQGPPGAYVIYSTVVKSGVINTGSSNSPQGGLKPVITKNIVTVGVDDMGCKGGGLKPTGQLINIVANNLGNMGTGLVVTPNVNVPQIKIWRAF